MGTKQRDYTWDVLKFILIVLVILGHWLQYNYKNDTVNLVVYNYRGLFTIPLFVFISGYFSRKKEKNIFFRDILQLLETYIVVQILYVVSFHFLQHSSVSWKQLYEPKAAAWFLLSLASWKVFLQLLPELWADSKWILAVSFVISLLAGFIPVGNEMSLQRTLAFFPFFMCGYSMKHKIEFGNTSKLRKWFSTIVLTLMLLSSFFLLNRDISFVIWCKTSYYQYPYQKILLLAFRALYLVMAFLLIYCILIVFPKVSQPTFLSRLGSDTLFYYIYHIVVMLVGIIIIRYYHLSLAFPAMLLYTVLSVVLLFFLGKIKLFRWLLSPFTSIRKLKRN